MFIVAAVGWVLDVSLSEQQKHILYMLIMFMDADVGWVLDVRLSKQETYAMLSYFLQRDSWLLRCYFWTCHMKFEFIKAEDAADRWVSNIRLSEQ
jgi:hypothetical protein